MDEEKFQKNSNLDPYCRLKPSPAAAIGCLYCGSGYPWFLQVGGCSCFRAVEAREGKRAKPRYDPRTKVYTLDPEAAVNSWLAKQLSGRIVSTETPAVSNPPLAVSTEVDGVSSGTDRKAYMRELMRKRRAAKREEEKGS